MSMFEAGVPISSVPGASGTVPLVLSNAVLSPLPSAGDAGTVIPTLQLTSGTAGNDLLAMAGGFVIGGEGADSFLLTPVSSRFEAVTDFGVILDFQATDKLDLSALGAGAKILGSEAVLDGGALRHSIDFDGDGAEDGFVVTFAGLAVGGEGQAVPSSPNAFSGDGPAVSGLSSLPPAEVSGFEAVTVGSEGQFILASSNTLPAPGGTVITFGSLLPTDAVPSAVGSYEVREATAEDAFVTPTLATFSADWIVA